MKDKGVALLGFVLALLVWRPAAAECSRPIRVPVAPIGLSVTVKDDAVGGVYPDVLRGLGSVCRFEFSVVPRARMEALFEAGQSDLLIPASRSARRDEIGVFVPMVQARPTLISLHSERPALRTLQDLLARRELRVALVRGFDYGSTYQGLMEDLRAQGRLTLDVDAVSIARMLEAGMADVTIMAPSILIGAMLTDARVRHLLGRLRVEAVEELPWNDAGVYVSRQALGDADRTLLIGLLERSARAGAAWRAFVQHYPASSLDGSIRPK